MPRTLFVGPLKDPSVWVDFTHYPMRLLNRFQPHASEATKVLILRFMPVALSYVKHLSFILLYYVPVKLKLLKIKRMHRLPQIGRTPESTDWFFAEHIDESVFCVGFFSEHNVYGLRHMLLIDHLTEQVAFQLISHVHIRQDNLKQRPEVQLH